jgi:hypothetical protein
MTGEELLAAAMEAAQNVPNPSRPIFDADDEAQVAAVITAVEPLIRADERERTNTVGGHRQIRDEGRADMCADLRAKVEALPGAPASGSGWIARADVLALLDGDSDD